MDINLDDKARECFKGHKETIIPWILMSSYMYYCKHTSILSDTTFDKMCKYLLDNWDDIDHPHKELIDKGSLRAGTLYTLKEEDYPTVVKIAAWVLVDQEEKKCGR